MLHLQQTIALWRYFVFLTDELVFVFMWLLWFLDLYYHLPLTKYYQWLSFIKSSENDIKFQQSSDSNSSIPPITPDCRLSTLQKNEVDTCIEQMLQACQLGGSSSSNSIKRAPSRTSVHSMNTIKNKVLQKWLIKNTWLLACILC